MSKGNKLDFDLYLMSEFDMTYDEYQSMSKSEKTSIRNQYTDYLESEE